MNTPTCLCVCGWPVYTDKYISISCPKCNKKIECLGELKSNSSKIQEPVGTELKKLISYFIWNKKIREGCNRCKNREQQMNAWGVKGCQKNLSIIIGWLKESALENNYIYSERVVRCLINKAIHKVKVKNEMVCSSNNCPQKGTYPN